MPLLLLLCFFLSGASGLCLEVVWVRQLTHVFGSTTLAISTVLATFMGGLALGSWLGGRYADRTRRGALASYALCELGIAACALVIPLALGGFALSGLVLVAPTTLMGATLPILARHVVRTRADFGVLGRRVGTLYAANTAGAVFG